MSAISAPPPRSAKKVKPPPVAKGNGKKVAKGVGEVIIPPPFAGGALVTLMDSNLLDVFTYLKPVEAIKWAQTNKTFATFLSSKAADVIWRTLLYSAEVDKFDEYKEKLPAARRSQLEAHFSCRRVISALSSSACSVCDGYAENFCVMTCSRACNNCWACRGVGEHGLVVQPLSLCAVGYAKTHYLLNDKDIKSGLFCLEINDATKAHGLISPKMTLVLESEARKLAEEKFKDVEGGLAAEKTSRADKAKEKWEERKAAKGKAATPKEPDSVRKEREKGKPTWWNFVAYNQAFISNTPSVAAEYGFYKFVYTRAPSELLTAPPSVFVTRDSPEQVMAKHPHVTQALLDAGACKIMTNLVDAVFVCANGGTLLIDMLCNLPTMAREAGASARCIMSGSRSHVGGQVQNDCINLIRDMKIVGTPRALITSHRAIFYTIPGSIFAMRGVRMSVTRSFFDGELYYAPALVLCNHCSISSCRIESESSMYAILMHAPSATISDCDITTGRAGDTVHIEDIKNVVFSGNRFSSTYNQGDYGFFFDDDRDGKPLWYSREQKLAFRRQLQKDNTFSETRDFNGDY